MALLYFGNVRSFRSSVCRLTFRYDCCSMVDGRAVMLSIRCWPNRNEVSVRRAACPSRRDVDISALCHWLLLWLSWSVRAESAQTNYKKMNDENLMFYFTNIWHVHESCDMTMSHCMIRYHTIWHNVTLYDTMSQYMTQCHIIWHNVTLYGTISHYMTQYHIIWHNVTLYVTMSHYMTHCHIIGHIVTLYDTLSLYMTHCHIIWHNVSLYSVFQDRWYMTYGRHISFEFHDNVLELIPAWRETKFKLFIFFKQNDRDGQAKTIFTSGKVPF